MPNPINLIEQMNIRITSVVWAVQDINEYYHNIGKLRYEELISRLMYGLPVETEDALYAEVIFKYIVVAYIKDHLEKRESDATIILSGAITSANRLITGIGDTMRSVREGFDIPAPPMGKGNPLYGDAKPIMVKGPKHQKGPSKQSIANGIIESNKNLDKPAILDLIMAELGITKAHAMMCFYKSGRAKKSND